MIPSRLAVIDLGSNTFHLLIVDVDSFGMWQTILKDRRYVKLASGGIDFIDDAAIGRAISVMVEFSERIQGMDVLHTIALGTAALREARNGLDVVERIQTASGIPIELIDGHQEAYYIWKGITSSLPGLYRPCLIMDIGGGSVEFIFYENSSIHYTASYKIGVAVLYRTYHLSDPIHQDEIESIERRLEYELAGLIELLRQTDGYFLIGASGSFEVIQDVLPKINASTHWSELDMTSLLPYLDEVIRLSLAERRLRPEIPVERLDYIIVAYVLIRFLVRRAPPEKLFYCDFALKEGAIVEKIEKFRLI